MTNPGEIDTRALDLEMVASDDDLRTFLEIQECGHALFPRLSATREDLLFDYDPEQLRSELEKFYWVDRETVLSAEQVCLSAIRQEIGLYGEA
jgi:hypothetical protein